MKFVWVLMMCVEISLLLSPANAVTQLLHKIPFATQIGILELTVSNGSTAPATEVRLSVVRLPQWMHIREMPGEISSIDPNSDRVVRCAFSVDRLAPITTADTLLIRAAMGSGECWTKMIPLSVLPPDRCELFQNYPNPFNPVTDIRYQIADRGFVVLMVYDLLGREVASLVSEGKEPGSYDATFDASGIGSGTYFYRLVETSDNGAVTIMMKNMTLLR